MSRVDIMVDLETLGNTKDASIIQIAAAKFDIETGIIKEELNIYVDIERIEDINATGSTIKWWLKTNPELFANIINKGMTSEKQALGILRDFISIEDDPYLWGNGILFDNAIIQNKMTQYGLDYPIFFRNDRDVRTIVDLVSNKLGIDNKTFIKDYSVDFGDKHDALNDVKSQISYVVKAYQILTRPVNVAIELDNWYFEKIHSDSDINVDIFRYNGTDLEETLTEEKRQEIYDESRSHWGNYAKDMKEVSVAYYEID